MKPDNNFLSLENRSDFLFENRTLNPDRGDLYDDILKVHACRRGVIRNCVINPNGGNREDGVDVMADCEDLEFNHCFVGAGRKYAFTIKACQWITLKDVCITRHGGNWEGVDIDLGNYAGTMPNLKTRHICLNRVYSLDGRPVTVRLGWADDLVVMGGSNVKILRVQSLGLKAYVATRRAFDGK